MTTEEEQSQVLETRSHLLPPLTVGCVDGACNNTLQVVHVVADILGRKFNCLIDSGSTRNFVSQELVNQLDVPTRAALGDIVQVADGRPLEITQALTLTLRPGHLPMRECFQVLPDLLRPIILGQPWLVKWLPQTNWGIGETTVSQKGRKHIF